jgi:hypothetical protein
MPSRDPKDLAPLLQEFWPKLRAWYMGKYPGRALILTCTHRTPAEQAAIYAQNKPGRILTRCDGVNTLSKHNHLPALAFDVAVCEKGVAQWREDYYMPLGAAIKELGYEGRVRWGGWWTFKDYPHLEIV